MAKSPQNDTCMPAVYAQRRERLRALLGRRNLDALLVCHAANRFYLSGFELHDSQPDETSGFLLITRDGVDWLATDSRYVEAAARLWPKDKIFVYKRPTGISSLLPMCGAVIGIEAKAASWEFTRKLAHCSAGQFCLLPVEGLVEELRIVKQPCEIDALKKSFRLNHAMLDWLNAELESGRFTGISEKELAWEIEKFFRENGAQELAFATIAAAGKNGALPHAGPGDDPVIQNGPLLIDVGCRVDDYCSDQTRVYWLGSDPSQEFSMALRLVREAQEAAFAIMRPGVACADVYRAAYAVFEGAGVAEAFTHGLGHGVGLETHELPSLSPTSGQNLAEGMVVTVEPGLYYPEWGGIRWEYTVLIEKDGIALL